MSAVDKTDLRVSRGVWECACVTVAFARRRRAVSGLPTMSERPRTTAERPERESVGVVLEGESEGEGCGGEGLGMGGWVREGMVERRWRTPAGVQGVKRGVAEREERFPILRAWNLFFYYRQFTPYISNKPLLTRPRPSLRQQPA
jgi:hypothetical protein